MRTTTRARIAPAAKPATPVKPAKPVKPVSARAPVPDRPVHLRLTAPEYQLVSYAASKTRTRGINAWMREAVVEAARHAAGKDMSEDILSGKGTVRLLKESLAEARRKP